MPLNNEYFYKRKISSYNSDISSMKFRRMVALGLATLFSGDSLNCVIKLLSNSSMSSTWIHLLAAAIATGSFVVESFDLKGSMDFLNNEISLYNEELTRIRSNKTL